mgnify:FL=1
MSFGKMNDFIQVIQIVHSKDSDGFTSKSKEVVASVRAYREGRHGNTMWANRASFTTATDLFRFRKIPNLDITANMIILCENSEFEIFSIEDVKGKKMYIEVLAKKVESSNGKSDS